jgi:hypothetical protein
MSLGKDLMTLIGNRQAFGFGWKTITKNNKYAKNG